MIEREDIPGQRTGKEDIPGQKTENVGTPDPTLLTECPSKKDTQKEINLKIPFIETMNTKDTRILT